MPRRSADTNQLWAGILVAALAVIALFIFDPFGGSTTEPDPMQADTDVPFVAILAEDEIAEVPGAPDAPQASDEVLGTVEQSGGEAADEAAEERGLRRVGAGN